MKSNQKILWEMYVVAEGLATLMDARDIDKHNSRAITGSMLPLGLCWLLAVNMRIDNITSDEILSILKRYSGLKSLDRFWFLPGDWKPRAALILKTLKAT
jgi:hypothetical protein